MFVVWFLGAKLCAQNTLFSYNPVKNFNYIVNFVRWDSAVSIVIVRVSNPIWNDLCPLQIVQTTPGAHTTYSWVLRFYFPHLDKAMRK